MEIVGREQFGKFIEENETTEGHIISLEAILVSIVNSEKTISTKDYLHDLNSPYWPQVLDIYIKLATEYPGKILYAVDKNLTITFFNPSNPKSLFALSINSDENLLGELRNSAMRLGASIDMTFSVLTGYGKWTTLQFYLSSHAFDIYYSNVKRHELLAKITFVREKSKYGMEGEVWDVDNDYVIMPYIWEVIIPKLLQNRSYVARLEQDYEIATRVVREKQLEFGRKLL